MRTLVVATDLSASSEHTADYAIQLAQAQEAQVVLCHVVPVPIVAEPQVFDGAAALAASQDLQATEQELRRIADNLVCEQQQLNGCTVRVEAVVRQGAVTEEVIALAKEREAGLVVVGSHQEAPVLDLFTGNHASAMLEHCRLPVLVVPPNAPFRAIRNILFASDLNDTDEGHLEWLSQFASYWDASVLVAHVIHGESERSGATEQMEAFIRQVSGKPYFSRLSFRLVSGASIAKELDHLIHAESVDWLAMATRKRNVFQQLTHRSLTKQLALETEIPLLAFHANRVADLWIL